jgi:hypothetical protein
MASRALKINPTNRVTNAPDNAVEPSVAEIVTEDQIAKKGNRPPEHRNAYGRDGNGGSLQSSGRAWR